MAEAEVKLVSTLGEEGGRDRLNVENVEGGQQVISATLMSTKLESNRSLPFNMGICHENHKIVTLHSIIVNIVNINTGG